MLYVMNKHYLYMPIINYIDNITYKAYSSSLISIPSLFLVPNGGFITIVSK
jgi:hypothetical protein